MIQRSTLASLDSENAPDIQAQEQTRPLVRRGEVTDLRF